MRRDLAGIGAALAISGRAASEQGLLDLEDCLLLNPKLTPGADTGQRRRPFVAPTSPRWSLHVRPNRWRNLKKPKHKRTVPLWPDLKRILREYVETSDRRSGLMFPAPRHGGLLTDVQGSLDRAVEAAGIKGKRVTLHTLRHTYTATRMQTTDNGKPVSLYTVMRELGHKDLKLIEEVYGHLQNVRDRSPVVTYRKTRVIEFPAERAASC